MSPAELHEKTVSTRSVFRGKLLDVYKDVVRLPDGQTSVRETIRHPGAAVMAPILNDGRVILVRQFRYALGQVMVELPAGKLDPGEEPETTARRELAEEIGYTCHRLVRLGLIHPAIGFSDEQITVYLATGLERTQTDRDKDEFLEPFELGLAEALEWIHKGKITDVKTIIALYWAEKYLAGGWNS